MSKANRHIASLVKNYLYNASYQILVMAVALVTTPYLSRTLGATGLGIYGYVTSVADIIQAVALMSLYTYGSREIAYHRDNARQLNRTFWELMIVRLLFGLLATAAYFAFATTTQYGTYLAIYYPWLLANILDISWLFVGVEDMKVVAFENGAVKIACVVCILLFVTNAEGLTTYLILMSMFTLVGNLAIVPLLRHYLCKPEVERPFMSKHIKGSVRLFLPEATSTLTHRINHLTMGRILPTADAIAFYDQGEKIVNVPSSLVKAMNAVIMPRLANEHAKGEQSLISHTVVAGTSGLMLAFPLMFGIIGVAKRLVPWFFGSGFESVSTVVQVLSPVVVVDCLIGTVGSQYLTATDRTKALTASNLVGLFINVLLNYPLIAGFGYLGAVISTVTARAAILVVQVAATARDLPYAKLAVKSTHYLLASAIMLVVLLIENLLPVSNVVCTLVQLVTGVFVYSFSLWMLRDNLFLALAHGVVGR